MKNLNETNKDQYKKVKEVWKKVKNRSAISTMLYQCIVKDNYAFWINKSINDYNEKGNKVLINKMYKGENKVKFSREMIHLMLDFLFEKKEKIAVELVNFNFKPHKYKIDEKIKNEFFEFLSNLYELYPSLILESFLKINSYYLEIYEKSVVFKTKSSKNFKISVDKFNANIKYHLLENNKINNEKEKYKRSIGNLLYLLNSNKKNILLLEKSYVDKFYTDISVFKADFSNRDSNSPSIYNSAMFFGKRISHNSIRKVLMSHLITLYNTSSLDISRFMDKSKYIPRYFYVENLKCMDKTSYISLFLYFSYKK